jgi:hypothetical protein
MNIKTMIMLAVLNAFICFNCGFAKNNLNVSLNNIEKHLIRRKSILSISSTENAQNFYKQNLFYSEQWIKNNYLKALNKLKFHEIPNFVSYTVKFHDNILY